MVDDTGGIKFYQLPVPTQAEIMQVTERIATKVKRWLSKRLEDLSSSDLPSDKEPLLAACYAASIRNYSAIGERAGQPLMRVFSEPTSEFDAHRGHQPRSR